MKDKVVIITGASSGIGKALAEKYASEGAKVVLAARSTDALMDIERDIRDAGGTALSLRADVSVQEDCFALIEQTLQAFGRIDILVNNAGISMWAMIEDMDLKVLERVMQVNFMGTVYCTKAALPHILKTQGSVVGVSSIAGFRGLPARSGYAASKFAMHGFLESLRIEMYERGVHILIACPGFTASNIRKSALLADGQAQGQTPLQEQKLMSPEEVARHLFHAIRKRKRTLILTGQGKRVVFVNKWLPRYVDYRVYKYFSKKGE